MGMGRGILLKTGATAAMGMRKRLDVGNIKHPDTSFVRIQDRVRSGACPIEKVAGAENSADILTKHVSRDVMTRHMETMGVVAECGRAKSAPTIEHK